MSTSTIKIHGSYKTTTKLAMIRGKNNGTPVIANNFLNKAPNSREKKTIIAEKSTNNANVDNTVSAPFRIGFLSLVPD